MTISQYLSLNDDDRYEEMRRATIAAMHQEYFDKYFKPTKKRWLDLTRAWDKFFNLRERYVLTSVIHKIYWGVYPYQVTDPDLLYLLKLVEAEMLDNGEAYQMWSKWIVFKKVLNGTLNSMCSFGNSDIQLNFIEHYHYLKSRALCKIKCEKEGSSLQQQMYIYEYQSYEEVVKQLIPEASCWSRAQWGNDLNIADAMKQRFGVDYSNSYEKQRDYERLIMMIRSKNSGDECLDSFTDYIWYVSNITDLPLSLARVIWPKNLESMAASMLWGAYELMVQYEKDGQPCLDRKDDMHPVNHYERKSMRDSWLFRAVSDWFYGGLYSGEDHDRMKMVIFELNTTC